MPVQRTLVLIKPDAVQRGLVGEILSRFERKGLIPVAAQFVVATDAQGKAHYAEHAAKPFFPGLLKFITCGPLLSLALEGDEAVAVVRNLVGPTDGRKAAPGTIRGDFGISRSSNLVHGSDSPEAAERELKIWFPAGVVSWSRCDKPWLDSE
jgi:nucleoside-diphosphate kinase